MKTTLLLLIPKILSFKTPTPLKAFLRTLPFIFIGLIFWVLFYSGTYKVLNFTRGMGFFGKILSKKLLSITFFSLSIFLILSNIITALSSFYMSKDIPFLMSKPIKIKEILRLKTIETISSSSWMVISFIPPFFIAYGVSYNASFRFYLMLILTFIPFLLIAGGIGITAAHLLTRIFSMKKLRLSLLATGLFLFLSLYLLVRSQWSISPESPERFFNAMLNIKTDSPLMPSFWITESLMPFLKRQTPDTSYLLLILCGGVFMLILSGLIGNRLYSNNIERIQPSIKHGIKAGTEGFYPGDKMAFLWKDVKTFFRDAGQWSQLFIIRTSPVTVKKLLRSKFLYGFIPVTVILLAVVFITNIAMGTDHLLMLLSGVTIFILCISISGVGTGMGAMYPRFRYENIASISTSPGGRVFMLFAFSVLLLTVSLEAWSFYSFIKEALSGSAARYMQIGQLVTAGVFIF